MKYLCKYLMGLISLIGFLFLAACNQQQVKEEFKVLPCEEMDTSWTEKPSYSEVNNGWVYSSSRTKKGVEYTTKTIYADKDKKTICSEFNIEKNNICSNQDSIFEHTRFVSYSKSIASCDSTCKNHIIHLMSDTYKIETDKKKPFIKRIVFHFHSDSLSKCLLSSKDKISDFLEKNWEMVNKKLQNDTISLRYLRFIFDKEANLCFTETSYFHNQKDMYIINYCEANIGYSFTYNHYE